ncbi:hypothetical protein [Psychroserpens sp. NJDZ02]|uniref:hypothetical protein n=1 Tax=Psychroserpens sp. NJDZ02 TaxID=2570561 RepID=UPI0010A8AE18|nr:hypothetical protein [Psychroserpens sp. NJDZ02]QCE43269.1 hypothetical protein E9099_18210 [Psychroserpens sp. NJDZ02]
MKCLLKFLIVLSSLSIHSQRLCEFGEYDFISHTIIGIDKVSFSKIKYINNDKPPKERTRSIYYYDDFGRLINVDFRGNGNIYGGEDVETGCSEIENANYKYSDTIAPKEIKVKDSRKEYSIMFYYNKFNKTKSIEYIDDKGAVLSSFSLEYDKKSQMTLINKGYIKYYYEWDDNSCIKKITIQDPFYSVKEYDFTYVNNKIVTVTFTRRLKNNKDKIRSQGKDFYTYKNGKLDKITHENIKYGGSNISVYNYDNEDKLIITNYNGKGVYDGHYECYY